MTIQISEPELLLRDSAWLRRLSHSLAFDSDEGEEIFNTTMVAAWERSCDAKPPGVARSWLAGVVRKKATRMRRDAARQKRRETRAARPEAQPSAAEIVERVELQGRVVEAVLGLGEPYTTTLLLRFWDDLKPHELAESLGVPVETVRTRLKRGLALLRRRLDENFGGRAAWLVPFATWAGVEPRPMAPAAVGSASVGAWVVGLSIAGVLILVALAAIPESPRSDLDASSDLDVASASVVPAATPDDDETTTDPLRVELEPSSASPPDEPGSGRASTALRIGRAGLVQTLDTMKEIVAAQERCRTAMYIDEDRDDVGEFGYFAELLGRPRSLVDPRKGQWGRRHLRVPIRFAEGVATIGGYCCQMYLPGDSGLPLPEAHDGGVSNLVPDPDLAEKFWCCYAWPAAAKDGVAGPVFFVDQAGTVLAAPNEGRRYVGRAHGPRPDAAYRRGTDGRFGDAKAQGPAHLGIDGQVWRRAVVHKAVTRLRVVDGEGRPVAKARVFVQIDSASSRYFRGRALQRRQREQLEQLGGLRLPLNTQGSTDADGLVSLKGPLVTGAMLMLADTLIPTRFSLDGEVLTVEMPGLTPEARWHANEKAAIATLKNISSAQAQCQASGAIDVNKNGAGEYGYFAELSGGVTLRGGEKRMSPPVLSGAFANVKSEPRLEGVVVRSGYIFRMFLPDATYRGLAESPDGGAGTVAPNPARSEVIWCCYAWPQSRGKSGQRAFFVNQSGDVLACPNESQRYSGSLNSPRFDAAFGKNRTADGMAADVAANSQGGDGERWAVVN